MSPSLAHGSQSLCQSKAPTACPSNPSSLFSDLPSLMSPALVAPQSHLCAIGLLPHAQDGKLSTHTTSLGSLDQKPLHQGHVPTLSWQHECLMEQKDLVAHTRPSPLDHCGDNRTPPSDGDSLVLLIAVLQLMFTCDRAEVHTQPGAHPSLVPSANKSPSSYPGPLREELLSRSRASSGS